jgi:diguanylate cyclase (GGDEF)-like protein
MRRYFDPGRIVNLCFAIVLVSSTVLTWREAEVLEDAYASSQSTTLEKATSALDQQMQTGVNLLLFYHNSMQTAMHTPLALKVLRNTQKEFMTVRQQPSWQIDGDARRTLPINGVSDAFVQQHPLLNRDIPGFGDEMIAAQEVAYMMRLSVVYPVAPSRAIYVSRAGYFVSTSTPADNEDTAVRYQKIIDSSWFSEQSVNDNPARKARWFARTGFGGEFITVSIPLDYQRYWYGTLALQFPVAFFKHQLEDALTEEDKGEYQLYDKQFQLITASTNDNAAPVVFSDADRHELLQAMATSSVGNLHLGSLFVSWQKLKHFDGVLIRIHSLSAGLDGDFGTISIVIALLWLLFTTMVLISWVVIRRMVRNMSEMQSSLQWQAWHDPLTRLSNRGGLFEQAKKLTAYSQQTGEPIAVIQIDLDHFKQVNDRHGHQAGDRVLTHVARLISNTLRANDVAGRIGGEEFCVIIPNATLAQAAEIAERIRTRIAAKEILLPKGRTLRITASLGVSSGVVDDRVNFELLQSIADNRLYHAKRSGRNQVCASDENQGSPSQ